MDNELAIIAIKGGRYSEAESIFNGELSNNPSSSSYFGLGICKLNMLLDVSRSVEEVSYCFNKAVSIAKDEERGALSNQALDYVNTVLIQYDSIFRQLEEQKKKEAKAAAVGAALTIGAAMIGSSHKSNAFTQIASLAAAGAGVGVALDGLQKLGEIPKMQEFVLETGEKLISEFVSIGIGSRDELQKSFNADELRHFIRQIEQENKASANHTISIILAIFGINRLYLRKWKSGILFLITYGGLGVWWAIDLYKVIKKDFNPKW